MSAWSAASFSSHKAFLGLPLCNENIPVEMTLHAAWGPRAYWFTHNGSHRFIVRKHDLRWGEVVSCPWAGACLWRRWLFLYPIIRPDSIWKCVAWSPNNDDVAVEACSISVLLCGCVCVCVCWSLTSWARDTVGYGHRPEPVETEWWLLMSAPR